MTDPVVSLDVDRVAVEPGRQASVIVKITNPGSIVEGYLVEVVGEGVSEWGEALPPEISVYPQQDGNVVIVFSPPGGTSRAPALGPGSSPPRGFTSRSNPSTVPRTAGCARPRPEAHKQVFPDIAPAQTATGWRRTGRRIPPPDAVGEPDPGGPGVPARPVGRRSAALYSVTVPASLRAGWRPGSSPWRPGPLTVMSRRPDGTHTPTGTDKST